MSTPSDARIVGRIVDGICARAEKGELALTQDEFDALQQVVMAWERGHVVGWRGGGQSLCIPLDATDLEAQDQ